MAITLGNVYPAEGNFYPAYNDMVLTATSTNTAQPNFKYVVDVYIAGSQVARFKYSPDVNGRLTANVHRIIENYVTYNIDIADAAFVQCANSLCLFSLHVGEEYGTTPVVYPNLSNFPTSGTRYAINTCVAWDDRLDYLDSTYILNGSSSKFLSTLNAFDIQASQNAWCHMIRTTTNKPAKMEVKTYDYWGNLLGQYRVANAFATVSATADRFLRFPCGTANLNLISTGIITVVSGANPIITASVVSYTIQALDNSNAAMSEVRTYTVTSPYCKYTNYRLHFLNKFGGFDSLNFALVSHETLPQINKKVYKKVYGTNTAGVWAYTKQDVLTTTIDVDYKHAFEVNSDWISDTQSAWLEELMTSPVVFREISATVMESVNLTTATYQIKKNVIDGLIQLNIRFENGFNNKRQRG